jgi:hypothetical protein
MSAAAHGPQTTGAAASGAAVAGPATISDAAVTAVAIAMCLNVLVPSATRSSLECDRYRTRERARHPCLDETRSSLPRQEPSRSHSPQPALSAHNKPYPPPCEFGVRARPGRNGGNGGDIVLDIRMARKAPPIWSPTMAGLETAARAANAATPTRGWRPRAAVTGARAAVSRGA